MLTLLFRPLTVLAGYENGDDSPDEAGGFGGGGSAGGKRRKGGEVDEFYAEAKAAREGAKAARAEKHRAPELHPPLEDEVAGEGRRAINQAIERNRGLTPHRWVLSPWHGCWVHVRACFCCLLWWWVGGMCICNTEAMRARKNCAPEQHPPLEDEVAGEGRRATNHAIEKNRGLTPHRWVLFVTDVSGGRCWHACAACLWYSRGCCEPCRPG